MPILSLLIVVLMVFSLIDIITRPEGEVKYLPKFFWIILVILIPLIGSGLWFGLGREYSGGGVSIPRRIGRGQARPAAPYVPPVPQRSTEEQIADLDREIEEWRLRSEIERRKAEGDDQRPT